MNHTVVIDQAVAFQPAKVFDYGFSKSKEKKTPYIWLNFHFDKEAVSGDNGETVEITTDKYITDRTITFLLDTLKAFDWHGNDLDDLFDKGSPNYFDLRGKACTLTVVMETYTTSKGVQKQKAVVQYINPPGSGQQEKPMELSEIKKISQAFKSKIAQERSKLAEIEKVKAMQGTATQKPVPRNDSQEKSNGEDIPF